MPKIIYLWAASNSGRPWECTAATELCRTGTKKRSIMDVLTFRDYCLSLPMAEETTPFDETTLVYKVGGKMFACADMAEFEWVAVKCDPAEAVLLREQYDEVSAAWHFNKRHWNAVRTTGRPARRLYPRADSQLLPAGAAVQRDAQGAARGDPRLCRGAWVAGIGTRRRFSGQASLFAGQGLRCAGASSFSANKNRMQ